MTGGDATKRNIISYSLFEPVRLYERRDWDQHRANPKRYWFNLPAIALINQCVYPQFTTRIRVTANCREQPMFDVLELLAKHVSGFEYRIDETPYTEFEPALWRMAPFWDESTAILLCRDTDSIPNGSEWGATRLFLNSEAGLHSIRSHPHHKEPLRILGGLCGFRPERIRALIPAKSYADYLALAEGNERDCDQDVLNTVFTGNPALTATEMMDSPVDQQHARPEIPCQHAPPQGRLDVSPEVFKLFSWVQREKLTPWAGASCSVRGAKLVHLLKMTGNTDLLFALRRKGNLKRFYLGTAA
jgi:hypothetical protein